MAVVHHNEHRSLQCITFPHGIGLAINGPRNDPGKLYAHGQARSIKGSKTVPLKSLAHLTAMLLETIRSK